MSLLQCEVSNVRCIEHAALEIPPRFTLIWGPNASGKTSLLEAVFLLGRGRSFRTRNSTRLIRDGMNHMRVSGGIQSPTGQMRTLTFEATREESCARIGSNMAKSLSELSQAFPVQVIEPGVHKLVEEGGYRRRRWLDWAVFHVEPRFMDNWLRYTRALKQRNASLKGRAEEAQAWDPELSRLGESISESRERLVNELQPYWKDTVVALSGLDVELRYLRGWTRDLPLSDALAGSRAQDMARRMTHVGPHRGDIAVRLRGRSAREILSRGQQKLVAMAMTLSQIRLIQDAAHVSPTLLLDDPAAELDGEHLSRFIEQVAALRCQLIVTSLHAESRLFGAPERTFRMDQGRVQPV